MDYAQEISKRVSCPLLCGDVTRLLVDLNRSPLNPHLFSSITKPLDQMMKKEILSLYYTPFRTKVRQLVEEKVSFGIRVIHISCHSFTPVLNLETEVGPRQKVQDFDSKTCTFCPDTTVVSRLKSVERMMDLGILYDPHRIHEKLFSEALCRELRSQTSMRVRLNAPYKGVSDGHVTSLRRLFSPEQYIGIELELNQSLYVPKTSEVWRHVWLPRVVDAIRSVLLATSMS
jgi:predicted N-formylglutamate amidohydrolase